MKKNVLFIVSIIIIGAIMVTVTILFNGYIKNNNDEITQELTDEFSRAKWFIVDWYNEQKDNGQCKIYLNELQFENGKYTLTVASNKIRAVYSRGERFFKLELIKQIEFFEVEGILRCRFKYGTHGEYLIRIN